MQIGTVQEARLEKTNFGWIILREHRGKDTLLQPFARKVFVFTAVEEDVVLSGMPMKIAVENQFGFTHESKAEPLSRFYREAFEENVPTF